MHNAGREHSTTDTQPGDNYSVLKRGDIDITKGALHTSAPDKNPLSGDKDKISDDDSASNHIILINPIYGGYNNEEENMYTEPRTCYIAQTGTEIYNKETENMYSEAHNNHQLGSSYSAYNYTTIEIAHSTSDALQDDNSAHKGDNIAIVQGAHASINTTVHYMSSPSGDGDNMSENDSIPDLALINPIYGTHEERTEKVSADLDTNHQPGMGMESSYNEIVNMNAESDINHQLGTGIQSCYNEIKEDPGTSNSPRTEMESCYDEVENPYADLDINHQPWNGMEHTHNFCICDDSVCDMEEDEHVYSVITRSVASQ